ncbi:flagellar basal body-associated protein FliL [Roseovarius sp. M141]|uniref:flagellar basal body-associated FliL family protein n=1 Tax=Roseovarius sp. M141 TaxID=2583806 RepID=UPI0020CCF073|nr:flagellar basal body-associated FliL family protein [Roseovarius sp. M141]MCQ0091819.1 flagellar basal body protein FliL [Roseovarius sp. M141]
MADKKEDTGETPVKRSKMPLIMGLVLALAGGGGGFYAVHSGLLFASDSQASAPAGPMDDSHRKVGAMPVVAYVPIEPLVISLGKGMSGRHLRFRAELEVIPAYRAEVEQLLPRVVDVLNTYLRALKLEDLTDSAGLLRLRAQMLRRVQVVTGGDRINDLLIMEFVLN